MTKYSVNLYLNKCKMFIVLPNPPFIFKMGCEGIAEKYSCKFYAISIKKFFKGILRYLRE